MPRPVERASKRNGFGMVVLGMVLTVCALVNVWLRAPFIADVLGSAAYGVAFLMSTIAACVAVLILDEGEPSVEEAQGSVPAELQVSNVGARRRS